MADDAVITSLLCLTWAVGGGLIAFGILGRRRAQTTRAWPHASGLVLESYVGELPVGEASIDYHPVVRYQYVVDGATHTGTNISSGLNDYRTSRKEQTLAILDRWQPGAIVDIYFDPKQPSRAVLARDISPRLRQHYLACILGGVLVAAAAGLLTVMLLS